MYNKVKSSYYGIENLEYVVVGNINAYDPSLYLNCSTNL